MGNVTKELLKYIHLKKGDITKWEGDAIVNAANPTLQGGGGVDGAIHRAAGPNLLDECKTLGGCDHGEARITKGYNLPVKYVIHTPGPIYQDGTHHEEEILKNCYKNSLQLAKDNNVKTIAFPAISTGIYGYPKDEACKIAITASIEFMFENTYFPEITFILFDNANLKVYTDTIKELG